ncbi:Caffeic acid 3-O-methyltransferase 3 [Bienertia sinuspersici]
MASSPLSKETEVNGTLVGVENGVDKLIDEAEAEDYMLAAQLVQSGTLPWVLRATVELDILGIIAKAGPIGHQLSPTEICTHLPTTTLKNPDAPMMVDRMLRLLANFSIVSCSVCSTADGGCERQYGLGRLSRFFHPDECGASFCHALALTKLKDAVLQGGVPFNMVHGTHAFEYPNLDPRFNDVINKATSDYPKTSIKMMLRNYKGFEGIKKLVDVGGGLGHHLDFIISKYPSIKGINFDLPYVIRHAPPIRDERYPSNHTINSM